MPTPGVLLAVMRKPVKLKLSQWLPNPVTIVFPHHGKTGSLVHGTPDDVPGTVVVGIHALDADREAGGVRQIRRPHCVELPVAWRPLVNTYINHPGFLHPGVSAPPGMRTHHSATPWGPTPPSM